MTKIKLSKRLQAIANLVSDCNCLADIGCDHALLDIYLLNNNIINKAIGCDITIGAINGAKRNVSLYDAENIELRLGDGINVIYKEDKVDTLVISGMGNQTIINILKENLDKLSDINTIIIQSNNSPDLIRKNVCLLGYKIVDECIIKDKNIIYEIIKFNKGIQKYNDNELFFGPILLQKKDDTFIQKIINDINKQQEILKKLPNKKIIKKIKIRLYIRKLKNILKK